MSTQGIAHPSRLHTGPSLPAEHLVWPRIQASLPRQRAALFAIVIATGLLLTGALWLAGAHGSPFAFLLGADVALLGCGVAYTVIEQSGARAPLIGAIGEGWSADALSRLGARWTRIDSVPFGSTVDIDHVLLSPAGVFVVETKFTGNEWSLSHPALLRAVSDARWRARKIEFLVGRAGRPRTTPVLVVWGPGAPVIPGGYEMVEGVLVCRGGDAAQWRSYFDELPPTLAPERVNEMVDIILDHTSRTESANRVPARHR